MKERVTRCMDCHAVLDEEADGSPCPPCPHCGCTKRHIAITTEDTARIVVREDVRLDNKDPSRLSKDKLRRQLRTGDSLHHNSGKWMQREQEVNKDTNRYRKRVVNPETGEVLRDVDEPLTEHRG